MARKLCELRAQPSNRKYCFMPLFSRPRDSPTSLERIYLISTVTQQDSIVAVGGGGVGGYSNVKEEGKEH